MEDERIVELYWQRRELAIEETDAKYGAYLHTIAYRILSCEEDAEESVNDTYRAAWDAMPPHRPAILSSFLGKLTRRISIDAWRKRSAEKRGGGETALALEELEDCVSGSGSIEEESERRELIETIDRFLLALPESERSVFVCRYWYLDPVPSIAAQFGFTESKVTSMLFRTRKKLRVLLEKEGY